MENKQKTREKFESLKVQLKNQPWFHGILPRFIVDELLINNGNFLVRVKILFFINLN
jgi:hypothetical protein